MANETTEVAQPSKSSASPPPRRTPAWYRWSAAVIRWLHIYLSMLGFATLSFFAFTGITLNHPTWFGAAEQTVRDLSGEISPGLVEGEVDKLAVAEEVRAKLGLRGRVTEFAVDDFECMLVFKSPGYAADVFVDRASGSYFGTETSSGAMAILNDLHKGRDSGLAWSWVIDVSAVLTLLLSISGFLLLLYLRRRRISGILTAVAGTVALVVVWYLWVP